MQGRRGCVEFESRSQTSLHKLEKLLTLIKQHRVVHLPAQPRVEAQLARTFKLRFGAVPDIHMEVGSQLDEFTPVFRLAIMDQDDVDICRAAKQRIMLLRDE